MRRILGLFTFFALCIFGCNAFAAGYVCDDIRQYTNCNAGYYMTYNGSYNSTPQVGNKCSVCPANSYCTGGTTNAIACNVSFSNNCATTPSITNGTKSCSGTQTCYHKTSPENSSSADACTGTQNCNACTPTTCTCSCNSGYHSEGTGTACQCVIDTVTVTYNVNSGSWYSTTHNGTQTCNKGAECTLNSGAAATGANAFYRAGYKFAGWSTTSGGTATYCTGTNNSTNCKPTLSANTTLYAVWTQCAAGQWKAGSGTAAGAACEACPSGYTSTAGATAQNSCYVTCNAGKYIKTANGSCVDVEDGYYIGQHNVNYGSTSTNKRNLCSENAGTVFDHSDGSRATVADCWRTCTAGDISNAYSVTTDGKWHADNTNTCAAASCKASYYLSGGACLSCSDLSPANTYTNSAVGNNSGSAACYTSCTGGTYVKTKNTACVAVDSGYYMGAHNVYYGNTSTPLSCVEKAGSSFTASDSGRDAIGDCYRGCVASDVTDAYAVTGKKYYNTTNTSTCQATSCKADAYLKDGACPKCSALNANYNKSNNNNSTGAVACYTTCSGGTYVATANAACTGVGSGYYKEQHTVNYGSTSTRNSCTTNAGAAFTASDSGRDAIGDCYRPCVAADVANATGASGKYYKNNGNPATCVATGCADNFYLDNQQCPACPSDYPKSDAGSNESDAYCYKMATKTGQQLSPQTPENCSTVSTAACVAGTCQYKDYKSATDGTCNPTDCTKTITGVTAKIGSYVATNTTCAKCPTNWTSMGGNINQDNCYRYVTLDKNSGNGTINESTGSSTAMQQCFYNQPCTFPATQDILKRSGYTYNNKWDTNADCTVAPASAFTITSVASPLTYFACSTKNSYTITLEKNGGTGTTTGGATNSGAVTHGTGTDDDTITCTYATSATAITLPSQGEMKRTGYNFMGWNTDATATSGINKTNCVSNQTLYAIWMPATVTCQSGEYLPRGQLECSTCKDGYYCPEDNAQFEFNAVADQGLQPCPNAEDGWTRTSQTGLTSVGQCEETRIPAGCDSDTSGKIKKTAISNTAWGNASVVSALYALPDYYVESTQCLSCESKYPGYSKSIGGRISSTNCYRDCLPSDIEHSTMVENTDTKTGAGVLGRTGAKKCRATACADGYYINSNVCVKCPDNSTLCGGSTPNDFECANGYTKNATNTGCDPLQYTITFDANGGTLGTTTNVQVLYGSLPTAIITSSLPTRATYSFTGFFDAASGGQKYYDALGNGIKVWNKSDNATLYAQWSQNVHYCVAGFYYDGTNDIECPENKFCDGTGYTNEGTAGCVSDCPASHPFSETGTNTRDNCYKTCAAACTGNDTASCVAPIYTGSCSYNSAYTVAGTQKYNSSLCVADTETACPIASYKCQYQYYVDATTMTCKLCTELGDGTFSLTISPNPSGPSGCYKSCQRNCDPQVCPDNNSSCENVQTSTGGGQYWSDPDVCTAPASSCQMIWECKDGYTKNTTNVTCDANTFTIKYESNGGTGSVADQSCKYDQPCTANAGTALSRASYIFNGWNTAIDGSGQSYAPRASLKNIISSGNITLYAQWVSSNEYCEEGYYYNGTDMQLCTSGYYCTGDGTTASGQAPTDGVDGNCRKVCPQYGASISSAGGATDASDCRKTISDEPLADGSGRGIHVYQYVPATDDYTKLISVTVTYCNDGHYLRTTTDATCNLVDDGWYRPAGPSSNAPSQCTPHATKSVHTSGTAAKSQSDCYISCTPAPSNFAHGSLTAVNNQEKWNGTQYPVCKYSATCTDGYHAKDSPSEAPSCVANEFTVQYNANGGTGTVSAHTCQYDDICVAASGDTLSKANHTFAGWTVTVGGVNKTYLAGASIKNIVKDNNGTITLDALWVQGKEQCVNGIYYDGTTQKVCPAGMVCNKGGTETNMGTAGCFEYCPDYETDPINISSEEGARMPTQCYKIQDPWDNFEHGNASAKCTYNETTHKYTDCNFNEVYSCEAGYWHASGDAVRCDGVQSGYYNVGANCNITNANTPMCLQSVTQTKCPNKDTDASVQSTEFATSYTACSKQCIKNVDHAIRVSPSSDRVNAISATQYADCLYVVECDTGYSPKDTVAVANPKCEPNKFIVTLNKNGGTGSVSDSVECTFGQPCTLPSTAGLSKDGYSIGAKWCTTINGGTCYDTGVGIDGISERGENITLYAVWTPRVFQITLNSNGGSGVQPQTVFMKYATGWYLDNAAQNAIDQLTQRPTYDGFIFGGFTSRQVAAGTDGDSGVRVIGTDGKFINSDATTTISTNDTTIFAYWSAGNVTCPAGQYYAGTGTSANCKPCTADHYCPGGEYATNGGTDGLYECPNGGKFDGTSNADKHNCYKTGIAYPFPPANVHGTGTQTCKYTSGDGANAEYKTDCEDILINHCEAGYWRKTATATECVPVGDGYYSAGGVNEIDASPCPTEDGQTGKTGQTTATTKTDCYLTGRPYTATYGAGTQTCYWGIDKYNDRCVADSIRITSCRGGYYCTNDSGATDCGAGVTDCREVGLGNYSVSGSILLQECELKADGATTVGDKARTSESHSACYLGRVYENIEDRHGSGRWGCFYSEEGGGYTSCSNPIIDKCDAGYYCATDASATECRASACSAVGRGNYSGAGSIHLNTCPGTGSTTDADNATAASVQECIKQNMSYAPANGHGTGTQTCYYTSGIGDAAVYDKDCKDKKINRCDAGYWRATTDATVCIAVGRGNYSGDDDTELHACEKGGTTPNDYATDIKDCLLSGLTYTATYGSGTQTCKYTSGTGDAAVYNTDCKNILINKCAAGYWRKTTDASDCELVGNDYYSATDEIVRHACPGDGVTDITNASSPEKCNIEKDFASSNAVGKQRCWFTSRTVDPINGTESNVKYETNCYNKIVTRCAAGYYYDPELYAGRIFGNGEYPDCVEVGYNHYGPVEDTLTRYMTARSQCKYDGKTLGVTSPTAAACYRDDMVCNVDNGQGKNTCTYDADADTYSSGCSSCTVTSCDTGYSHVGNQCIACPANNVCKNGEQKTCASYDAEYPNSSQGTTDESQCWRECRLAENAATMRGKDFKGDNQCEIESCKAGYTLKNGRCEVCAAGEFCTGGSSGSGSGGGSGGDSQSCRSLGDGSWDKSDSGATSANDCYKTCENKSLENGTAIPLNDKAFWPNQCEYRGESETGNPCDIIGNRCKETSCISSYEMINDMCKPCNREHAMSYAAEGNCVIATCAVGYHSTGLTCVQNITDCAPLPQHATVATQTWDFQTNEFGACIISECATGYHIESNTCVADEQVCNVEHGTGIMHWDDVTKAWGDCIATSCDAGFTNNVTESNDPTKQCGACRNKFGVFGEEAASKYSRECQISECLYEGQLYHLENNECTPICSVDGYSDETGTMKWNPVRKICERTCKDGYLSW